MEVLQFPKDKKKHVYFEKKEKLEKGGEKSETTYGCHSVAKRGLRFF